jgi:hypothetical protein
MGTENVPESAGGLQRRELGAVEEAFCESTQVCIMYLTAIKLLSSLHTNHPHI